MKIAWTKRDPDEARARLRDWLSSRPGVDHAEITTWVTPRSGNSNETIYCDARWTQQDVQRDEALVLRIQPDSYRLFHDADVFLQWNMMEALNRCSDIPVPPLYWQEPNRDVLGSPFFVMGKVPGNVPPDLISLRTQNFVAHLTKGERRTLYLETLATMAALHNVHWQSAFNFLDKPKTGKTGLDQYLTWVEEWFRWAAAGRSFPLIAMGLRYLRDKQPRSAPVGIVWGDARPGNMIVGEDLKPVAVIDWEMAALGPPEVDVAWWVMWENIWNAPDDKPELEGFLTRDEMLEHYQRFSAKPLKNYRYYEILAGVRLAIMMVVGVDKRIEKGVLKPDTTANRRNPATQFLAPLLDQPLPGLSPDLAQLAAEMG
jgi:aminoglycoside phosphotransferase (APT) family kinase protein